MTMVEMTDTGDLFFTDDNGTVTVHSGVVTMPMKLFQEQAAMHGWKVIKMVDYEGHCLAYRGPRHEYSSNKMSSLASRVLSGYKASDEEVKSLAGSVLTQSD